MNTGDIVKLKSGGPAMTIQSITGDWAICVWFDSVVCPVYHRRDFALKCLELVTP